MAEASGALAFTERVSRMTLSAWQEDIIRQGELYRVGGSVRDRLLGLDDVVDTDYLVRGIEPPVLESILSQHGRVALVGKVFGVYHFTPVGEPACDIAFPRTEVSTGPGHRDFAIQTDWRLPVEADLGRRVWPVLQQEWPFIEYCGLRDAFVIRYALGGQEHLRIHHDVAQVSASVKLNDGYEGGELSFPRQSVTNAPAVVGELLAWPSLVTHPHETSPLRAGVKYALTIWFELPGTFEM